MNQLATNNERLPMDSVGISTGSTGAKIAPQNLAEVVKFAEVMCRADIALPKHLRGNAGACMAVALQAMEWELSPFAVASKSYTVNGAIAYEAQLIAAVVNTRSGIKGRLKYRYDGSGNEMTCTVTGVLDGDECEYTTPPIGSITPKNSPLWKTDPQQQLGYFAARSWARRHCPEVILGVYDRDEAEQFRGPDNARDITPQPSVMERLRAAQATQEPDDGREGFDASFVHSETETALNGEILTDNTESVSTPSETGNADSESSSASAASDDSAPNKLSDAPLSDADLRKHLMEFAVKAFATLGDRDLDAAVRSEIIDEMIASYKADVIHKSQWSKLSSVTIAFKAVFAGKRTIDEARSYVALDVLDCSVAELGGSNG